MGRRSGGERGSGGGEVAGVCGMTDAGRGGSSAGAGLVGREGAEIVERVGDDDLGGTKGGSLRPQLIRPQWLHGHGATPPWSYKRA